MKIELNIDRENFLVKEGEFCGLPAILVGPNHVGCKWTQANKIFRSSVWSKEGVLLSAGFQRFPNLGENPDNFPAPTSLMDCSIIDKIDGCCDGDSKITTKAGAKSIKDICEAKYDGEILAFDVYENKKCWTKIEGHSIAESTLVDEWYELELKNGTKIKLTGNHLVWLPKLKCYRRVDKLVDGDDFLFHKK